MKEPAWFCYGCMCPCCSAIHLRTLTLGPEWQKNYICCQGYFQCCCFPKGCGMGKAEGNGLDKNCPELCLCLEAWLCTSCAISANRFLLMDKYNIVPDPMDNKIIQ
jgi:hypothetical protein